jgi:hypothetical protein
MPARIDLLFLITFRFLISINFFFLSIICKRKYYIPAKNIMPALLFASHSLLIIKGHAGRAGNFSGACPGTSEECLNE